MDNPKVYTNYVGIFKDYIVNLLNRFPDTEVTVVMGESAYYCGVDIPGNVIIVTQNEMLCDGKYDCQEVLRSYYRYCHDRTIEPEYMDYHCNLLRTKIDIIPDVIITKDNAPYLEKLYPEALMLYTEVGFISRRPFPKTMYFDKIGLNCSSYLSRYWDDISKEIVMSDSDKNLLRELKLKIKTELEKSSPYAELFRKYREKYSSIWLLPLQFSRFSNIDGEIKQNSQLDIILYVLDHLPGDVGLIVSTHPDFNVLTPNVIWYLRRKYENFIYDASFYEYASSSQYIMSFIDGVINISSSVGLQTMFWDIPCVQIGEYFAKCIARRFNDDDCLTPLSFMEKEQNDKVLYWLLTRYVVLPEYYTDPEWLQNYFLSLKSNGSYPMIDDAGLILKKLISCIDAEGLPERSRVDKAKKYYDLLTAASNLYFGGKRLSDKLKKREFLIYGKSSLAYLLEMEVNSDKELSDYYRMV